MFSCHDQVCEPNTFTTTFSDSSQIQMIYDTNREEVVYLIFDGDGIVFKHRYYHGHCEGSADDNYSITLAFELPTDLTEFTYKDSALIELDCFVHHSSTWTNTDYPVTSGTLEGQKQSDDNWVVRGSVDYSIPVLVPQVKTIVIDRVFSQ